MAVCPNCSRENPENAVFCEACGSLMSGAYADTVPVEPAPVTRMRQIGGSAAMLFLAILQTLTMVLSIPRFTTYTGYSSSGYGFHINFPIGAIFTCIAFWLIYYTCKKPVGHLLSTGGLTILRVFKMLNMISCGLAVILIIAAGALLTVFYGSYSYYYGTATYETGVFVLVVILISFGISALFLSFLYSLFAYRFLGSVKQTAATGFPACRSAAPLAVFSILSGVFSLASSALTFVFSEEINELIYQIIYMVEDLLAESGQDILFNARVMEQASVGGLNSILSTAAAVFSAIGAILIGILALRYRAAMKQAD